MSTAASLSCNDVSTHREHPQSIQRHKIVSHVTDRQPQMFLTTGTILKSIENRSERNPNPNPTPHIRNRKPKSKRQMRKTTTPSLSHLHVPTQSDKPLTDTIETSANITPPPYLRKPPSLQSKSKSKSRSHTHDPTAISSPFTPTRIL
jgi:hypothetical protein